MLQLIKNEIIVYEGIKQGKSRHEISTDSGLHKATVSKFINILHRLWLIEYVGRKEKIKIYRAVSCEYVEVGGYQEEPDVDRLLQKSIDIRLTDDQMFYLRNHKKMKRSVLAKKLGVTKLALNFTLDKLSKSN
ncbi:hypothetical protein [Paenibacillus sp. UNC451MF]|uniref:hypothetical protein n=1 Tax=Paenibacillus sp. UNC451MF TaxID=1449063 RepID=UPI00048F3A57|nr:hypothetical protein [Paenibacillus sp. UNC451MF]